MPFTMLSESCQFFAMRLPRHAWFIPYCCSSLITSGDSVDASPSGFSMWVKYLPMSWRSPIVPSSYSENWNRFLPRCPEQTETTAEWAQVLLYASACSRGITLLSVSCRTNALTLLYPKRLIALPTDVIFSGRLKYAEFTARRTLAEKTGFVTVTDVISPGFDSGFRSRFISFK